MTALPASHAVAASPVAAPARAAADRPVAASASATKGTALDRCPEHNSAPVRPYERGQVRIASAGSLRRLVFIVAPPSPAAPSIVRVTLVHSYPEYAIGSDRVLAAGTVGLRYPLVVQLGMESVVGLDQLEGGCLATVPETLLQTAPQGPRLCGPFDARSHFKSFERRQLALLCADCISQRLDWLDGCSADQSGDGPESAQDTQLGCAGHGA